MRINAEEFRKSENGMELLAARKTVLEGLFGEAKRCHGLRRAKQRGVEKVEIQALMIATALNIKRLLKGLDKTTLAQPMSSISYRTIPCKLNVSCRYDFPNNIVKVIIDRCQ